MNSHANSENNGKVLSAIVSKQEFLVTLLPIMEEEFSFKKEWVSEELNSFLDQLTDNFYAFIEYPYVDKFYRNSYYNYFATKHRYYPKDCIRVSLFIDEIRYEDFRGSAQKKYLTDNFLGYFILRPTLPRVIGRSVISPKLLKTHSFKYCAVRTEPLINGVKLHLMGFPYSSQDTETITCAETTVWVIMEYFGHKYPDYKPVLPSKIISTLSSFSYERQLPSHGLSADQISYALKQYDFGVRLYSEDDFQDEFKNLFFDYIESGIPFIATLQNVNIGHAITVFGQENISAESIDDFLEVNKKQLNNGIEIIDCSLIERKYLAMDDNYPPFKLADFSEPTSYYHDPAFAGAKITSIIVPLYPKIYLEAFQARALIYHICETTLTKIISGEIVLRLFLTSSRSYKNFVSQNLTMDLTTKNEIIETKMPKFIWVAELSTREIFKKNEAMAMIVLDATEANEYILESLLFIAINDKFIKFHPDGIKYSEISLKTFNSFNNLKGV